MSALIKKESGSVWLWGLVLGLGISPIFAQSQSWGQVASAASGTLGPRHIAIAAKFDHNDALTAVTLSNPLDGRPFSGCRRRC